MVDYTMGLSCVITCGCGSIKLKLLKPCAKYPNGYLYVGMPCFNYLFLVLKKQELEIV
jgi:hypothetical protein